MFGLPLVESYPRGIVGAGRDKHEGRSRALSVVQVLGPFAEVLRSLGLKVWLAAELLYWVPGWDERIGAPRQKYTIEAAHLARFS